MSMVDLDASLPSRVAAPNGALLSAALSGLLCMTASCESGDRPVRNVDAASDSNATDRGAATDTPPSTDVVTARDVVTPPTDTPPTDTPPTDTPAATDTPVVTDAPANTDTPAATDTPDGAAPVDATTALDVPAAQDVPAINDAGSTLDVRTGDVPFVCDVATDRLVIYSDATPSLPYDVFEALCNRVGGSIEIHPHCGGANSCGGFSYDETIGVYTEHSCRGLNTCTGYTCVRR